MNKSDTLCIIPCGSKKIWDKHPDFGPVEANRAYISAFHRFCKAYATEFFDHWVILSAKYGFLFQTDSVEGPYDVAIHRPSEERITMPTLQKQAVEKELMRFEQIVVLAGRKYRKPVIEVFQGKQLYFPFEKYKGIGYIQQALKNAVLTKTPLH